MPTGTEFSSGGIFCVLLLLLLLLPCLPFCFCILLRLGNNDEPASAGKAQRAPLDGLMNSRAACVLLCSWAGSLRKHSTKNTVERGKMEGGGNRNRRQQRVNDFNVIPIWVSNR